MKKKLLTLLAILACMALVACGETKTSTSEEEKTSEETSTTSENAEETVDGQPLVVALEAGFAPFEYMGADGEVVGVDVDICEAIAASLNRPLKIENMSFDGALAAVGSGKADMVASGVSIKPEREEIMDFSDSYFDTPEVVVVNAKKPAITEAKGEALNDMLVGVQLGNVADEWVSNEENTKPKEIKRYEKFAQAAEDLKNEKIDAIVMDEEPAKELVAANKDDLMILEGEPLFVDQYAIGVKKGNDELREAINKVIAELKEAGKIEEFLKNHSTAE